MAAGSNPARRINFMANEERKRSLQLLRDRVKALENEKKDYCDSIDRQISYTYDDILKLQNECQHVMVTGFMWSYCDICGMSDY